MGAEKKNMSVYHFFPSRHPLESWSPLFVDLQSFKDIHHGNCTFLPTNCKISQPAWEAQRETQAEEPEGDDRQPTHLKMMQRFTCSKCIWTYKRSDVSLE